MRRPSTLVEPLDPASETIRAIECWPDAALFSLARVVAGELLRRDLPQPAALPVLAVAYQVTSGVDLFAGR